MMAEIPEEMSNAQAAAIPIVGITAMACLMASGTISNKKILITGAAGGVGRFACQFAAISKAQVFAVSRRSTLLQQLEQDGIKPAGVFTSITEAKLAGSYDLILGLNWRRKLSYRFNRFEPKWCMHKLWQLLQATNDI
jgi:NADPH:quinone reductase-like Zn-dependent oxidoreductase